MLPRLPSKPARQNSFGSQSKARRHEGSRSRRSESDLVAEIGRFREEQNGNIFIALYKHWAAEMKVPICQKLVKSS